MATTTFIPDQNPFKLAGPPQWFLRRLYEFDPSLVIVPSRQGFYYRLAQRRPLKLPEKIVNDVMKEQADAQMLASYSLVPITTILATTNWDNPLIFLELQRRAPWRMGGAAKYEQMILAQEKQDLLDSQIQQDDKLNYLAKDAWRFYNKQVGLRSHAFNVKTPNANKPSFAAPALRIARQPYKPTIESAWGNVIAGKRRRIA